MIDRSFPHRRAFHRAMVATLGGATALTTGAALGRGFDDPPEGDEAKAKGKAEGGRERPADPVEAEVSARMALLEARYGDRWDEEARGAVERRTREIVARGRRLRGIALDNGEGPFPSFRPYLGEGGA